MTPEQFSTICKEYDNAPDDYEWDKGHPIFQLADENDRLKSILRDGAGQRHLTQDEIDGIGV